MSDVLSLNLRPRGSTALVPAPAGVSQAAQDSGETGKLAFVRDPFRLMLFSLTLLNVSRLHQAIPQLGMLRPALLLVGAAGVYAFLYPRALSRGNVLRVWVMRRVSILAVMACLSAPFGLSLGGSASYIINFYAKTLFTCLLLALAIRNARDLYTMLWSYVISCGILSYFALFVFQLSAAASVAKNARLSELYMYDANDVCVVMLIGLAFTLLLLQVTRGIKRVGLIVVAMAIGASLARSGSRGGFLGLIAFGAAALLLMNTASVARRVSLLLVVLAGMAAFAPTGYWEQMQTITSPKDDYNMIDPNGRKALMMRGLGYMKAYPFFGVGIDNFGRAECEISGIKVGGGGTRCGAPHNSYVESASELGVVGGLIWATTVFGGIFAMWRLRRRLPRSWRRGNDVERLLYNSTSYFAIALTSFAVSCFFVSFAWLDIFYIVLAMMTGL